MSEQQRLAEVIEQRNEQGRTVKHLQIQLGIAERERDAAQLNFQESLGLIQELKSQHDMFGKEWQAKVAELEWLNTSYLALIEKKDKALKESIAGCRCTLLQRESGHLIDCYVPDAQEALELSPEESLKAPREQQRKAAALDWQPIETAPKDYEPILIWIKNETVVGWFSEEYSSWRTYDRDGAIGVSPTHWRPLPVPPGNEPKSPAIEDGAVCSPTSEDQTDIPEKPAK